MGEKENLENMVSEHISRADQSLKSASILLSEQLFDDSISRSYYAVYHFVRATLLSIGEESKTHKGQFNLFYLHFVKTGKVEKALHKNLAKLLNLRGDADHGSISLFEEEDAKLALQIAHETKKVLEKLLDERE